MVDDNYATLAATDILPAWFIPRMMNDVWFFALVTDDHAAILISTIHRVRCAGPGQPVWLDVELLDEKTFWGEKLHDMGLRLIYAPTSRSQASINANHIVAAFEIADT